MSITPQTGTDNSAKSLRLVTLGRLVLLDPDGIPEPSLSKRRRKLALLAYLALQRNPVPRALVIDVFWGERDEVRARNSLSDAISHLRRVLGKDLLDTHAPDLGINHNARLSIDVLELLEAAAAGDHRGVIQLYAGPFLSGVFIDESSAFEDWSAQQRQRLEELFVASCAAECGRLAGLQQWSECAALASRWLAAQPVSCAAAQQLITALRAPGTREALVRARAAYLHHQRVLAREYELKPDAEIRQLADEVEEALRTAPEPPPTPRPSPPNAAALPAETSAGESVGGAPRRRRWIALSAVAGAATIAVVAFGSQLLSPNVDPLARPTRPSVSVAPMVLADADSSMQWLVTGLPSMVLDRLARVSGLEVVRDERMMDDSRSGVVGPISVTALGTLAQRDSMLIVDLSLRWSDGRISARVALAARGPLQLADMIAVRLLNALNVAPGVPSIGELETVSVEAYQQMAEAERLLALGESDGALRALDAAIALDSSFVSAAFLRFRFANLENDFATLDRLRPHIVRERARASEWDRLYVDMYDAMSRGEKERPVRLALALVERYPHNSQSYYIASDVLRTNAHGAELVTVLTRALDLWSAQPTGESREFYCGLMKERGIVHRELGNLSQAITDLRRAVEMCPHSQALIGDLTWALIAGGHTDKARAYEQRRATLAGEEVRFFVSRILLRERNWPAIDSVIASWRALGSAAATKDADELLFTSLRERGRFIEVADIQPDASDWARLVHFETLARVGRATRFREVASELLPPATGTRSLLGDSLPFVGYAVRPWAWRRALYADGLMRLGDTAAVRTLADSLAEIAPRSYYGRDRRVHHHLNGLLAAHAGRHADAARAFESAIWIPAGWTRTNLELARSYRRLGRPGDAVAVLRAAYAANLEAMGRYATQSELDYEMARSFAQLGMRDSAAVYTAYVQRAWLRADPGVRALLDSLPRSPLASQNTSAMPYVGAAAGH